MTGSIGKIGPDGELMEYALPGPGHWGFRMIEPYGVIPGPEGAVWFAEQKGAAIGRITPAGELQTFAIPSAPGTSPGGRSSSPYAAANALGSVVDAKRRPSADSRSGSVIARY